VGKMAFAGGEGAETGGNCLPSTVSMLKKLVSISTLG